MIIIKLVFKLYLLNVLIFNNLFINAQIPEPPQTVSINLRVDKINNSTSQKTQSIEDLSHYISSKLNPIGYNFLNNDNTFLNIKISIKVWKSDEDINLIRIVENISGQPDIQIPSLEMLSAIPIKENIQKYIGDSTSIMIIDILEKNKIFIPTKKLLNIQANLNSNRDMNENYFNQFSSTTTYIQTKMKSQPILKCPMYAKLQHIRGTVIVELILNPEGRPVIARLISGPDALVENTLVYGLQCRFEPELINGIPQWSKFRINIKYK